MQQRLARLLLAANGMYTSLPLHPVGDTRRVSVVAHPSDSPLAFVCR